MVHQEKAAEMFTQGFTCSQAVAAVFARQYGADMDTVLKISRGFGGGMGGIGSLCGAVTGAFLALGMGYDPSDRSAKAKLYAEVKEFTRRFRQKHGQVNCPDLLGCDVSTEAGKALLKEKNLLNTHCAVFVKDAVEIVEGLIAERV